MSDTTVAHGICRACSRRRIIYLPGRICDRCIERALAAIPPELHDLIVDERLADVSAALLEELAGTDVQSGARALERLDEEDTDSAE